MKSANKHLNMNSQINQGRNVEQEMVNSDSAIPSSSNDWELRGESSKNALIRQKAEQQQKELKQREGMDVGRRRQARIDLSNASQDHINQLWKGLPKNMINRTPLVVNKKERKVKLASTSTSTTKKHQQQHHSSHHKPKSSSSSSTPPSHHKISSSPLKQGGKHSKHAYPKRAAEDVQTTQRASAAGKAADFQLLPSSVLVVHSFDAAASRPTIQSSIERESASGGQGHGSLWSSIAPVSSWNSAGGTASILGGNNFEAAAIITSQTTAFPSSLNSRHHTASPTVNARASSVESPSSTSSPSTSNSSDHFSLPHNTPILVFIVIGSVIVAATLLAGMAWLCRWSGKSSSENRRKRMKSSWSPSGNSSVFEVRDKDVSMYNSPLPDLIHRNSRKGIQDGQVGGVGGAEGYLAPIPSGQGWTLFDRPVPKSSSMGALSRDASQLSNERMNLSKDFEEVIGSGGGGNYSIPAPAAALMDQDVDVEQSIWPPPARRPSFIERLMASRPNSTLPGQVSSDHEYQQGGRRAVSHGLPGNDDVAPPTATGFNITRSNTMTQSQLSRSISLSRSRSNGAGLGSGSERMSNFSQNEPRKSIIQASASVGDFRKGPYPTIRPLPGYGIDTPLFTHPFSPANQMKNSTPANKKSNLSNGGVFSSLSIWRNAKNERNGEESDFEGTIGGKDRDLPKARRLGKGQNRFPVCEDTTTEEGGSYTHGTPSPNRRRSSIIEMGDPYQLQQPSAPFLVNGTPRTPGLAGVGAARLWEEMEVQNCMLAQANAPFGSGPVHQSNQGQRFDLDNREMLSPLARAVIPGQNGGFNSGSLPISQARIENQVSQNHLPSNLQVFETLRARQALIEAKVAKNEMIPGKSNDYPNHPRTKLNEKIAKWWAVSSLETPSPVLEQAEAGNFNDHLSPLPEVAVKRTSRQRKEVTRSGSQKVQSIPKLRRIQSEGSIVSEVTSISAVEDSDLKNPYLGKQLSIRFQPKQQGNGQVLLSQESSDDLIASYNQLTIQESDAEYSSQDEKDATIYFGELPQLDMTKEVGEFQVQTLEKKRKPRNRSRRSSRATTRTESSLPPAYRTEGSEESGSENLDRSNTIGSNTSSSLNTSTTETSIFDQVERASRERNTAERAALANQEWGVGIDEKESKKSSKREQRRRSRELNIKAARDMVDGDASIDDLNVAELQR